MQGVKLKVRVQDDGIFSNTDIDYYSYQLYATPTTQSNQVTNYQTISGTRTRATPSTYVVLITSCHVKV